MGKRAELERQLKTAMQHIRFLHRQRDRLRTRIAQLDQGLPFMPVGSGRARSEEERAEDFAAAERLLRDALVRRPVRPLDWDRATWRSMWAWLEVHYPDEDAEHTLVSDLVLDMGHIHLPFRIGDALHAGSLRNLGADLGVLYAARAIELGWMPPAG